MSASERPVACISAWSSSHPTKASTPASKHTSTPTLRTQSRLPQGLRYYISKVNLRQMGGHVNWDTRKENGIPGKPAAFPEAPVSDFRANSMLLLGNPISMSWTTIGSAGAGDCLRFFVLTGRMCCTGMGVVASLELQSSNTGLDGWVASTAKHWHTASAAAYANERQVT